MSTRLSVSLASGRRKNTTPKYVPVPKFLQSNQSRSNEDAFQLGRRSFITGLVAILMIPFSAAIGYYMNKFLQRPALEIVYINQSYIVASGSNLTLGARV
jgi:hypothetical protein